MRRENIQRPSPEDSWQSSLAGSARLQVPDSKIQFLYDASLRTLILLSAGDVLPGPYTYWRFWFRNACLMLNAMLAAGLSQSCRRLLKTFFPRQNKSGYFKSQDGEWDSNGQVLWVVDRFQQLTGEDLPPAWIKAVIKGADWIKKKRKTSAARSPHALDAPGVREVVADRKNGRLLSADTSPHAFAGAIESFFQNSVNADRWRRHALETARNLSREICARRLERLYRSVLNEHESATMRNMSAEFIPWDSLLEGIKVEWELLFQKTTAAADAIRSVESQKLR